MQARVAGRVEDGQQDEAGGADDGEGDGQGRQRLLGRRRVGRQAAAVAQPAVERERQVQQHRRRGAAGHEERLERRRPHVADVGDPLRLGHRPVVPPVLVHHPVQQQGQQRRQPDGAGEDGRDPVGEADHFCCWRRWWCFWVGANSGVFLVLLVLVLVLGL